MKSIKFFNKQSNKIKGGIKMIRRLHIYVMFLVATLLFVAGCGGNGSQVSTFSDAEKTAKVSLSFQFPPDGEAGKAVISDATTHILVNVWQGKKKKDGTIYLVNFERKLIDKATPSATLDLFPAYTNICATQWAGNPNEIYTSKKLETICSFGVLQPGSNNVTLRMIRGNWTLNTPFAFNNTTSLTSFSLYRKGYPLYEYENNQGLNDVTYGDFNTRGMAKFNYGSDYNVALKATKTYYGSNGYYLPPYMFDYPSQSFGFYTNFFGMGDTAPAIFIGKDETTSPLLPRGYALFGLPKKTDTDGWFRQSKEFIEPLHSYNNYNNDNLALVKRTIEAKIEKWSGSSYNNNQTSAILDQCVPSTVTANSMTLCAGKEDSVLVPVNAFNQYSGVANSYKVTFKGTLQGVDICYDQGGMPILDASGNVTGCYSYNAGVNYNPSAAPTCLSGTWNATRNRCELTIQDACTQVGGTWTGTSCINMPYTSLYSMCNAIQAGPNMWNYYDSDYNVCTNNGVQGNIICYDGGTFNTTTMRCEEDLQTACYGGTQAPGEVYDAATKTCSFTEVSYVGGINLKQLTATGVGRLESGVSFTASKASDNTAKFKMSIPKK